MASRGRPKGVPLWESRLLAIRLWESRLLAIRLWESRLLALRLWEFHRIVARGSQPDGCIVGAVPKGGPALLLGELSAQLTERFIGGLRYQVAEFPQAGHPSSAVRFSNRRVPSMGRHPTG